MKTYDEYLLTEGAWGSGPLDNDGASDWKWDFARMIMKEIKDKLEGKDPNYKYYAIGMWEFFRDQLETQYCVFSEEKIKEMDDLCTKVAKELLDSPEDLVDKYKDPEEVEPHLEKWLN